MMFKKVLEPPGSPSDNSSPKWFLHPNYLDDHFENHGPDVDVEE